MLNQISYFLILGKPLIFYLGIITFLCLVTTAMIQVLNIRGITSIPIEWHKRMAAITIALAAIHGLLAVLAYF